MFLGCSEDVVWMCLNSFRDVLDMFVMMFTTVKVRFLHKQPEPGMAFPTVKIIVKAMFVCTATVAIENNCKIRNIINTQKIRSNAFKGCQKHGG